jgi:hypothetical protein
MRALSYALVAVTLLWSAAAAQNNSDQRPPAISGSAHSTGQPATSGREAPVGHRQPRAKDVPSWIEENLGTRTRRSTGNCVSAAIADLVCAHRSC